MLCFGLRVSAIASMLVGDYMMRMKHQTLLTV